MDLTLKIDANVLSLAIVAVLVLVGIGGFLFFTKRRQALEASCVSPR